MLRSALVLLMLVPAAAAAEHSPGALYQQLLRGTALVAARGRQGTGWLADGPRRLLVTNAHVVGTEEEVAVLFPDRKDGTLIAESRYYKENYPTLLKKGRAVRGRVVAAEPGRDLAVLELSGLPDDVVPLPLAKAAAAPGDRVHSVGNPGASDALWLYTTGSVRQVYRNRFRYETGQEVAARLIETQAPLNPGDSGGAVVNDRGEVVGVNAGGKANAQLVSLCVDGSEVKALLDGLAHPPAAPETGRGDAVPPLPRHPTAADHNNRGVDFHSRGQYERALSEYTAALKKDPNYALAYRNRALTLFAWATALRGGARPYLLQATADLGAALHLNPRDAEALRERALIYTRLGEHDKAIKDLSDALTINPEMLEAYRDRRKAYLLKGDVTKADADLDKIVKRTVR